MDEASAHVPQHRRERGIAQEPDAGEVLEVVTGLVRRLALAARLESRETGGLSLSEFRLLKHVAAGARTASQLASVLDVTPATVSAAVDALVRRGFLERHPSEQDRRCITLMTTEAGRAVLDAAVSRQRDALSSVMAALRPEERRALTVAVSGLARAAGIHVGDHQRMKGASD